MRTVKQIIKGMPATDGAGVELTRVIGQPALNMLDPFLLLDAFRSDNPEDYIAGFPPHPHRGFETVTYLLAGRMRHKDNAGHEGVIESGGIQWMTAGRGIEHSEMPEQENGLLEGFQPGFQVVLDVDLGHRIGDFRSKLRVGGAETDVHQLGVFHRLDIQPPLYPVHCPLSEQFLVCGHVWRR